MSIDQYLPPASGLQQSCCCALDRKVAAIDAEDGRTDTDRHVQTPDRYVNPAQHTLLAASVWISRMRLWSGTDKVVSYNGEWPLDFIALSNSTALVGLVTR